MLSEILFIVHFRGASFAYKVASAVLTLAPEVKKHIDSYEVQLLIGLMLFPESIYRTFMELNDL